MKIDIRNLAPIKEGVFEEKDLTLVIGDNGTGKTILLETVSYIKDFYSKKIQNFTEENEQYLENIIPFLDEKIEDAITQVLIKEEKIDKQSNVPIDLNLNKTKIKVLVNNERLQSIFNEFLEKTKEECTISVKERVLGGMSNSNFNFELLNLPKYHNEYEGEIVLYYARDEFLLIMVKFEDFARGNTIVWLDKKKSESIKEIIEGFESNNAVSKIKNALEDLVRTVLFNGLYSSYFETENGSFLYLPSERNMYRRNVYSKAADIIDEHNAVNKSTNEMRYSESLFYEEFLRHRANEEEKFEKFSKEELNEMMLQDEDKKQLFSLFKGQLLYNSKGDIESILRNDGLKFPRRLFSTKENKLIPYDMITSENRRYDRIIVEEPEANMSLASMTDLINFFEYHIKNGNKMTLTTHSDVFFSKMTNLIMRNNDFTANVYELQYSESGTYLKEIVKNEYGYKIELFKNELNYLFEETVKTQDGEE